MKDFLYIKGEIIVKYNLTLHYSIIDKIYTIFLRGFPNFMTISTYMCNEYFFTQIEDKIRSHKKFKLFLYIKIIWHWYRWM